MNLLESLWVSPLVHRFGCGLLHFVWQGLLIAVVLAVAMRMLRGRSAGARYLTAWAALLAMALVVPIAAWLMSPPPVREPGGAAIEPPGVELPTDPAEPGAGAIEPYRLDQSRSPAMAQVPVIAAPVEPSAMAPTESADDPVAATGDPLAIRASEWIRPALPWIVCCWIVGAFALSLWRLSGWMFLRRLCRLGTSPASDAAAQMLERLLKRLRVDRAVQLLESALIEVPTVIGWLRPVILLPASIVAELPGRQLEMILAHELAHIRRHDFLLNLVQTAIETLLFYHPAVWWVSQRIRIEREACCDDLAVAGCGDRLLYARALARLEELRHEAPSSARAGLGVAADGAPLLSRIRQVLGLPGEDHQGRRTWLGGSVAVLLVIGALVGYAATASEPQSKPAEEAVAGEAEATPAEKAAAEPEPPASPKPLQAVYGRVLDHQGKPVAGATVFLRGKAGVEILNGRVTHGGCKRVVSNADGHFTAPGGGEQATHVVVLAPHLNIWAVPVPDDCDERGGSGSEGLIIKLPQPAALRVVFDVPGAIHPHEVHFQERGGRFVPPDGNAQFQLTVKKIDGEGWKGANNTRDIAVVANPGEVVIDHLAPGVYDFYRNVILIIPQGGGTRSHLADRREVALKPGETKVIRLVRDKGQHVEGEIEGLPEGASGAQVNVWAIQASGDPEKAAKPKLYDWLACERNGRFVTSLLEAGKYRVTASAYAPRKPRGADSAGGRRILGGRLLFPPPDYRGSTEVTIKESGPPVEVRIEMKATAPAAKAPASRQAQDRAKQLKAHIESFHLDLSYYGKTSEGGERPSNRLILYVKPTQWKQPLPPDLWAVQITKDQAEKIVDHLATEGFLDQARRSGRNTVSYRRPGYVLWVRAEGLNLYESLGWDLKMLRRLEALRKILDGDAAKAMDKLLASVEPQRKLWEAADAGSSSMSSSSIPEWGKAVDGVQVRLRAAKSRSNEGRTVRLWANVRNQGSRNLLVTPSFSSCALEVDGRWYRRPQNTLEIRMRPQPFPPGRHYDNIGVDVDPWWELKASQDAKRPRGTEPEKLKLTGGKHTIRVAFAAWAAKNAPGKPVRAVSNPVVIEVISAKEIAARPERLKSQKDSFELRLAYHGPRKNPGQSGVEDPIRSLILHTTLTDYDLLYGWSAVSISEEQAAGIIDHLQADGSLVDALPFTDDHPPPDLDGPAYSLTVKGPENVVLYKPLGWGLAALDFLERLRTVLDGEAAKAVDQVMDVLGPQRKQWEAVAKWGRAVEGVQVRLRAEKPKWTEGVMPQFSADVRNLGTRTLLVYRAGRFWTSSELEIDGRWYRRALPEHNYRPPLSDLVPGRQFDNILVNLRPGWSAVASPSQDAGETGVTLSNGRLRLVPGKHTIRVAPTMPLKGNRPGDHVRAISNPVEIEIVAASPGRGARDRSVDPVRLPDGNAGPSIKLTAKASKRTWQISEQAPRLDVKVEVLKPHPGSSVVQRAPSSFILEVDGKEYEDHAIYTAPFLPIASFDHPLDLDNQWRHGATHGRGGEPLELKPGKHTIRVLFRYGRAVSNPVEIEFVGRQPEGHRDSKRLVVDLINAVGIQERPSFWIGRERLTREALLDRLGELRDKSPTLQVAIRHTASTEEKVLTALRQSLAKLNIRDVSIGRNDLPNVFAYANAKHDGTIRGRVVDPHPTVPSPKYHVMLWNKSMERQGGVNPSLVVGAGEAFEFRNVGPGDYELRTREWRPNRRVVHFGANWTYVQTKAAVEDGKVAEVQVVFGKGDTGRWNDAYTWGEAVDGVIMRVTKGKFLIAPGEKIDLHVDIYNGGNVDRKIVLNHNNWELEIDGKWLKESGGASSGSATHLLEPKQPQHDIDVWVWLGKNMTSAIKGLPPGKHTLRVAHLLNGEGRSSNDPPQIRVVSQPVMIEVVVEDKGEGIGAVPPGKTAVRGKVPGADGKPVRAVSNPVEVEIVAENDEESGATGAGTAIPPPVEATVEAVPTRRVIDAQGKPIAGAKVGFHEHRTPRPEEPFSATVTDQAGEFSCPDQAPDKVRFSFYLVVSAPGFRTGEWLGNFLVDGRRIGAPLPGTLRLDREVTVSGMVLSADGKPLAGVPLAVDYFNQRGTWANPRRIQSDAQGRFKIDDLPPADIFIRYEKGQDDTLKGAGDAQLFISHVRAKDGQQVENVTVDLSKAKCVVEGQLVDHQGNGIEGASIKANFAASASRLAHYAWARTDRNGRYRIEGLPPHEFLVSAWAKNHHGGRGERVKLKIGETKTLRLLGYLPGRPAPEPKPDDPRWGKPAGDLRAAVELRPGRKSYELGEIVEVRPILRNTGEKTVTLIHDFARAVELQVTDEAGKAQTFSYKGFSGRTVSTTYVLEPGHEVEMQGQFRLKLLGADYTEDLIQKPGTLLAFPLKCRPGAKYTLSCDLGEGLRTGESYLVVKD